METPREYHYVYYSYEEYGRGYFGSRTCKCLPEDDVKYFGSFSDRTFKPTHKIILKDDYATREEAYTDEIILQRYYKVVENPHFANRAYQTSTKFQHILSPEQAIKNGKVAAQQNKKNKTGIFSLTSEQLSKNAVKGGTRTKELKLGVHSRTEDKMTEDGRKGGLLTYNKKIGIHGMSFEQKSENGKRTIMQKWKCLETGFITNAASLTNYQKARGIDTTKRARVS